MPITNNAATAFSNQRKIARLSTGRTVTAYSDTGTNAKFKWSDDGVAWTDYSADIAGWINGSFSSYVDSGGVERLVAAWKQSGAGGGRTDARVYTMVGTFNAGRTTLTWGTAWTAGDNDAAGGFYGTFANYPDIV